MHSGHLPSGDGLKVGPLDEVILKYVKFSFIPSALIYAFGYLIHANYYRSIGLSSIPFAKAQYIETGITFVVFSFALLSFVVAYFLSGGIFENNYPWHAKTFRISTSFLVAFLSLALSFYSLFVNPETLIHFPLIGSTHNWTSRYFFMALFGIIAVGVVVSRWRCMSTGGGKHISTKSAAFVSVFASLLVIYCGVAIWGSFAWLGEFCEQSLIYFVALALLCLACWRIVDRHRKDADFVFKKTYLILTSTVFLLLLFVAATEYSFSAFRYIPVSRGGVVPEYKVSFIIKKDSIPVVPDFIEEQRCESKKGSKTKQACSFLKVRDAFVIAEDDKHFLLAKDYDPSGKVNPVIYTLNKSDVIFSTMARVDAREQGVAK